MGQRLLSISERFSKTALMCSNLSLSVPCRTLNGLLELVKGVGKIQWIQDPRGGPPNSPWLPCHCLGASNPEARPLVLLMEKGSINHLCPLGKHVCPCGKRQILSSVTEHGQAMSLGMSGVSNT